MAEAAKKAAAKKAPAKKAATKKATPAKRATKKVAAAAPARQRREEPPVVQGNAFRGRPVPEGFSHSAYSPDDNHDIS